MKWLWVFLAAIVAGALAGATLLQDPGYVMVRAGDLVFEKQHCGHIPHASGRPDGVLRRQLYCSAPRKALVCSANGASQGNKAKRLGLASSSSGRLCR